MIHRDTSHAISCADDERMLGWELRNPPASLCSSGFLATHRKAISESLRFSQSTKHLVRFIEQKNCSLPRCSACFLKSLHDEIVHHLQAASSRAWLQFDKSRIISTEREPTRTLASRWKILKARQHLIASARHRQNEILPFPFIPATRRLVKLIKTEDWIPVAHEAKTQFTSSTNEEGGPREPSCRHIKADCVCVLESAHRAKSPPKGNLNPLLNKAINMKRAAHLYCFPSTPSLLWLFHIQIQLSLTTTKLYPPPMPLRRKSIKKLSHLSAFLPALLAAFALEAKAWNERHLRSMLGKLMRLICLP